MGRCWAGGALEGLSAARHAAAAYAVRPGFEVGYRIGDKYFVNNHLMFKILVHETNGQYTINKQAAAELEAAAAVEVRPPGRASPAAACCLPRAGVA